MRKTSGAAVPGDWPGEGAGEWFGDNDRDEECASGEATVLTDGATSGPLTALAVVRSGLAAGERRVAVAPAFSGCVVTDGSCGVPASAVPQLEECTIARIPAMTVISRTVTRPAIHARRLWRAPIPRPIIGYLYSLCAVSVNLIRML